MIPSGLLSSNLNFRALNERFHTPTSQTTCFVTIKISSFFLSHSESFAQILYPVFVRYQQIKKKLELQLPDLFKKYVK